MKLTASNSRVAFAYQLNEQQASALNVGLSPEGNRPIVRVVQPASLNDVTSVSRNPDYTGDKNTPAQAVIIDKLVSATVSQIVTTPVDGFGSGTQANFNATNAVYVAQLPSEAQNFTVIDIALNPIALEYAIEIGGATRAIISLYFESGATEVLDLYLKDPNETFINIDPETLSLSDEFAVTADPDVIQGSNSKLYLAYSTAKAYKSVTDRESNNLFLRLGGAHIEHGAAGLYYTYGQPWGFVSGTMTEPLQLNNCLEGTATGTSTASKLKWFSAKSDMSATTVNGIANAGYQWGTDPSEYESTGTVAYANLALLYQLTPTICTVADNSNTSGTQPTNLYNLSPQLNFTIDETTDIAFGQRFGWYCDSPDSDLYGLGLTSPTFSRQTGTAGDYIFGAPFSFGGNGNQSYDLTTTYAEERPGFDGNFTSLSGNPNYDGSPEAGTLGAGGPASAGNVRIYSYLLDAALYSNAFLIHGGGNAAFRANYYNYNGTPQPTNLARVLLDPANTTTDQAENPYTTTSNVTKYRRGTYIWSRSFLSAQTQLLGFVGDSFRTIDFLYTSGSVSHVIAASTNAANFFYAGTAGYRDNYYESVFKGIIRVMALTDGNGGDIVQFSQALADQAVSDGADSINGVDTVGIGYNAGAISDGHSIFYRSPGNGSPTDVYNPIDLTFSALFNNLHINGGSYLAPKSGTHNTTTGIAVNSIRSSVTDTLANSYDFSLSCQDIAYLNVGVNVLNRTKSATIQRSTLLNTIQPVFNHVASASQESPLLNDLFNNPTNTEDEFMVGAMASWQMNGWNASFQHPPYPVPLGVPINNNAFNMLGEAGITSSTLGDAESKYINNSFASGGANFSLPVSQSQYILPRNENTNNYIISSGVDECFKIILSSVEFTNTGTGAINLPSDKKVTLKVLFQNQCDDQFKADDGTIATTSDMSKAERVAHVLEIFPHIEYHPLAAQAGQSSQNLFGLAYKTIVTDSDDVDDISIEDVGGKGYVLKVVISQDNLDVFNNPDDGEPQDAIVPGVDLWLDTPLHNFSNDLDYSQYAVIYGGFIGLPEYSYFKGSFFTISHTADWSDVEESGNYGTNEEFVYHHQFLTFGRTEQDDIEEAVEAANKKGCTDSTADNYDPEAIVDDGSCIFCEDNADGTNGFFNFKAGGLSGLKAGVYNSDGIDTNITAGQFGGFGTPSIQDIAPFEVGTDEANYWNSWAAQFGGAVSASNDIFNEAATDVSLSIKTNLPNTIGGIAELISYIGSEYGETETAWKLEIKPVDDNTLASVYEDGKLGLLSYSVNSGLNSDLEAITAIYSSTATSGSISDPRWDNIAGPGNNLSGLKSGQPYFLVLSFEPSATALPAACTSFLADQAKSVSLMWVTFCGCAAVGNDYLNNAMAFTPYEWQNSIPFPIIGYQGTLGANGGSAGCPDINLATNGDSPYGTGADNSLCFQSDALADDCDDFFIYCVASTNTICESVDATNIESLNEAGNLYVAQDGATYLPFSEISVLINIEGVYNTTADTYILPPNLQYTIQVTGPDGSIVETQYAQDQLVVPGTNGTFIQHEFANLPGPGTYSVQWQFIDDIGSAVYPDNIGLVQEGVENGWPCTYTETFVIAPPSSSCGEVIFGCTDPGSENYDEFANLDDGSCTGPADPCPGVWVNPDLSVVAVPTPSDSDCTQTTVTVGGVEYTANVVTPQNNGSIATTTTYTPPAGADVELAVNSFAVLVFPTNTIVSDLDSVLDTQSALFNFFPNEDSGITVADGLGYYSNLFVITSQAEAADFTFTFNNLPPGEYYIVAIPNLGSEQLQECAGNPFIILEDQINTIIVAQADPAVDCPEPCFGIDCSDYTLGCTDPAATNYDPEATIDDGGCDFDQAFCEANPSHELCVGCDDAGQPLTGFRSTQGKLGDEICDPYTGSEGECTDPLACNYNPDAVLSNNNVCDYCSCDTGEDPACNNDEDCEADNSINCDPFEPECPDPNNPKCDPVIYDPCPAGNCYPPVDPCIILGNCGGGDGEDDGVSPVFFDENPTIELTCLPEVRSDDISTGDATYDNILISAFQCMSEEGKRMLFKMKAGADYEDTDLLKLSLVSYLLNGGSDFTDLPCIFNCNYDSPQKAQVFDAAQAWANSGARFWNSTDTFQKNEIVMYFYPVNGVMTRNFYRASRIITPLDLAPRYQGSGWHRLTTVRVRTADTNGIATGEETYLQTFVEFMTRHCETCTVQAEVEVEDENVVDPTILPNSLDPKTTTIKTNRNNPSGILGEDGDEIIF